jgi:transposase
MPHITKNILHSSIQLSINIIMKLRFKYRIYPTKLQEHNLNQTAGNARFIWNHFLKLNIIEYEKEKKFIFHYHQINQWLASTKTCNNCGHKKEKLDLNVRMFECDECGYVKHRDINSSYNIRDWGSQEVGYKPGSVCARVDVIFDILSSDMVSSTQLKQEAHCG